MRLDKASQLSANGVGSAGLRLDSPRNTTEALLGDMLRAGQQAGAPSLRASFAFERVALAPEPDGTPNLSLSAFSARLKCSPYAAPAGQAECPIDMLDRKPRSPASLNFFQQRDFRIRGWRDQDLRSLPLAEIINTEAAHLDSHVPLYHAMQVGRWAINHFMSRLIDAANLQQAGSARHWLRNPADPQSGLPKLSSLADMRAYLDDSGIDLAEGLDNRKGISTTFLSCNPSILQNSDVASEECTADFYYDNNSVNQHNATQVDSMLSSLQPALTNEERSHLAATLVDAITAELHSDRGVLYQFFIPHAEVRDLVYISGQNGIPHAQHEDSLHTLLQLQTQDAKHVVDFESLQARLYLHPLMDLTRRSDVKLNHYHELSDQQIEAFERRIDPVINRLLA